jgi:hypothetical protein
MNAEIVTIGESKPPETAVNELIPIMTAAPKVNPLVKLEASKYDDLSMPPMQPKNKINEDPRNSAKNTATSQNFFFDTTLDIFKE